jgi:hypothetical protein
MAPARQRITPPIKQPLADRISDRAHGLRAAKALSGLWKALRVAVGIGGLIAGGEAAHDFGEFMNRAESAKDAAKELKESIDGCKAPPTAGAGSGPDPLPKIPPLK